jgi:hypothetical protein
MRPSRLWLIVILSFCFAATLIAQNPSSSTPQALTTLQSAFQALAGKTTVNDATLTGSAEWIAGSDDETGTVVLKTTSGANRLDLNLSAGTRSEIRSSAASGPVGGWIGPDGVSHAMAYHNVMTDAGWFPAFILGNLISSSNTVLVYVGQETRNGASVIHISASQQFPNLSGDSATLMQHLTHVDIYLDPTTSLLVSYLFNSHPDNNALLDIPTEIRYSNYQTFGGAQIPLHVQKFINNTLTLDLQFQNAALNTGITAAQIIAQ